jgi:hypothetical protein
MTSAQAQIATDYEIPLPLPRPNPAATIPAEYHGEWCFRNDTYYVRRSPGQCSRQDDGWIEIRAKTYTGWETDCYIFKIQPARMGHFITFDCHFDGDRQTETYEFVTTPGSGSGYKTTRLYISDHATFNPQPPR